MYSFIYLCLFNTIFVFYFVVKKYFAKEKLNNLEIYAFFILNILSFVLCFFGYFTFLSFTCVYLLFDIFSRENVTNYELIDDDDDFV